VVFYRNHRSKRLKTKHFYGGTERSRIDALFQVAKLESGNPDTREYVYHGWRFNGRTTRVLSLMAELRFALRDGLTVPSQESFVLGG
jgi:hypothetical protein